ncbi:alpha/beta fold hydrolase [Terracidiphilus sp.]|uniref:alpha/beta fold hydrolase n=1 Tax=Terracidiphilus sp. TaxID=1964191 RepID=UPI003C1CD736
MPRHFRLALFALSALLLAASVLNGQSTPTPLTVEAINGDEPLTGTPPAGVAWSPDGKHLTWLENGELHAIEIASGRRSTLISRDRLASMFKASSDDQRSSEGMPRYWWSPDSNHLLFDSGGRLWLFDLKTGTAVEMGFTAANSGDNPTFSPNGETIAFVRDHGLWIVRPRDQGAAGTPVAIAPSQSPAITNGEVDWLYGEELEVRSNYAWSPDSSHIAYLQMNESNVPEYPLIDWTLTHPKDEQQRYPQPGDSNPELRLGIIGATGSHTSWIRLPIHEGQDYIPRFGWVDRKTLWFETLSRDHKRRALYFADAFGSRDSLQILEVTDDKFLDDNYGISVSEGAIVLTSWKDGYNHIYLYRYDTGNPMSAPAPAPKQLTSGNWDVISVAAVDPQHQKIYYASNETSPLEQQLWQVSFAGERKSLTTESGAHEGNFPPMPASDESAFVDTFSTHLDPPRLRICKTGSECNELWTSRSMQAYRLQPRLQLETKTKDGTTLYSTLMLPEGAYGVKSVPLIVNPYGGPTAQTVMNRWGDEFWGDNLLFDQLLAQHGFAVLRTDNRGTAGRGRDFAQAAYRDFGKMQFEDQIAALDAALEKFPQLDPKRLGWWGWSWGGHFTLYAMTHSDRFVAGVAVAPVTDWRIYDSTYTERYLGQPADEPQAYKDSSVVNTAANLKGRLLLVYGASDDNVHIGNSVQFIDKLVDAGTPYDLQIFPRKKHDLAGSEARLQLYRKILAHFEEYLKPDTALKESR